MSEVYFKSTRSLKGPTLSLLKREGLPKAAVHTVDPYLAKSASEFLQKQGYINGMKRFEPKT